MKHLTQLHRYSPKGIWALLVNPFARLRLLLIYIFYIFTVFRSRIRQYYYAFKSGCRALCIIIHRKTLIQRSVLGRCSNRFLLSQTVLNGPTSNSHFSLSRSPYHSFSLYLSVSLYFSLSRFPSLYYYLFLPLALSLSHSLS